MKSEEHSCLLRRLTLCDGQAAAQAPPRTDPTGCYCVALEAAERAGDGAEAGEQRTARARVVARAGEVERIRSDRQRRLQLEW